MGHQISNKFDISMKQIDFAIKLLEVMGQNYVENPVEIVPEEVPKTEMALFLEELFSKTKNTTKADAKFQKNIVKRKSIGLNFDKKEGSLNFTLPTEKDEFIYPAEGYQEEIMEKEED